MNKKLMKRVIMDVQNEGCPEANIAPLLDCFENLMTARQRLLPPRLLWSWPT